MQFEEADEGPYRIYAAALPAPVGRGYVATLVVKRRADADTGLGQLEAFRDTAFTEGLRWSRPEDALECAIDMARTLIQTEPHRLRC